MNQTQMKQPVASSPDEAQRNPGVVGVHENIPDSAALHPGYQIGSGSAGSGNG